MQPRLSKSRKWTDLPSEFLAQVRSVFEESFKKEIGAGKMAVQGKIFPDEILIRVSYQAPKSLKASGFDISVSYKAPKDNVLKLLHLAVDAGASLMEQVFTSENDHDFPRTWEEVNFEKRVIYVKYATENPELEAEADKLLGEDFDEDEGFVSADWDDEDEDIDPDELKAKLGVADADDEDEDADDGDGDDDPPAAKPAAKKPKTKH